MKKGNDLLPISHPLKWIRLAALFALTIVLAGCDLINNPQQAPGLQETLVSLQVQQTLVAQEQTARLEQMTQMAQTAAIQTQQASLATQQALPLEAPTEDISRAIQETVQAEQSNTSPEITLSATQEEVKSEPEIDFDAFLKSAKVLLYENMVINSDTNRYVKDTLDRMGLDYKDDGNAQGWLKTDILNGAPGGKPWDLVIIAAEAKSDMQGEFFEYMLDVLDKGSSVILEVWYLDQIASGAASSLLEKCGVDFEKNWIKVPPSRMVMFPLDSTHPILHEPNPNLSFTKVTDYWWDETLVNVYDIGDWMKISSTGDAKLLVGTMANEKKTHGTVAVCMDDRLVIQTFSSHQLAYNTMTSVWENYIYNTLRARFEQIKSP